MPSRDSRELDRSETDMAATGNYKTPASASACQMRECRYNLRNNEPNASCKFYMA
jgi:hypothetical protein